MRKALKSKAANTLFKLTHTQQLPKRKVIQERKKSISFKVLCSPWKEKKGNTRKNETFTTNDQELNKLNYFMKTTNRIFKRKPNVISVSLEPSKDVFPSTETSLPTTAGNEGAAELAPSRQT